MTEYRYEYGKRWNVKTPRASIKFIVDRFHVGTPFAEIEQEINKRIEQQPNKEEWTPSIRKQCVAYARIVHEKNGELYRKVMRGC